MRLLAGDFRDVAKHVPDGLALVHLDADHTYQGTADAFDLYTPKLAPDGHVIIHDAYHCPWIDDPPVPDVIRFVADLQRDPDWERVAFAERSAAFRRA